MRTASQPTLSQQLRQKNGAAEECAAKAEVPRQREIPGTEAAKTLQRVVRVIHADSRDALKDLGEACVDSVVTDPPYALVSITKRWGPGCAPPAKEGVYARATSGFMGKQWDTGETAFDPAFWSEVLRVLKPGGHLIAFGGTRTYHRLVCAIEDGGFEIRDQLAWLFGSGFPKSHNLKEEGWQGWGTALKPAHEPICLARKPLIGTVAANVLEHGTGALNIDASRVETAEDLNGGRYSDAKVGSDGNTFGAGINLRSANNYSQPVGRWPANVIHDGSPEVLAGFPETGVSTGGRTANISKTSSIYGGGKGLGQDLRADEVRGDPGLGDSGSAARFFYTPKADKADRCLSKHPTVKPIDLMAYLIKLVTPPGGLVLDPFAGSGSTGMAAMREGFNAILIEREAEYVADIQRRLDHVHGRDTPLFAEIAS